MCNIIINLWEQFRIAYNLVKNPEFIVIFLHSLFDLDTQWRWKKHGIYMNAFRRPTIQALDQSNTVKIVYSLVKNPKIIVIFSHSLFDLDMQ